MAQDPVTVTVTESRRILKFAEGADPEKDTPFEIIEKEVVHTGQDALDLLEKLANQAGGGV